MMTVANSGGLCRYLSEMSLSAVQLPLRICCCGLSASYSVMAVLIKGSA